MSRIDALLVRLTYALVRSGDLSWALSRPASLDWPSDLPPLPEDLHKLLSWRDGRLLLPFLSVSPWQACAEHMRKFPRPGRFTVSVHGVALEQDGVHWLGGLVAESLADFLELEALIHERLPSSYVRRLRLQGEPLPEQPCPAPDPQTMDSAPPGTLWYAAGPEPRHFVLKLGPRQWLCEFGYPYDLHDLQQSLFRGALWSYPSPEGEVWTRSALEVRERPPREQLLERSPALLGPELRVDTHGAYGPPGAVIEWSPRDEPICVQYESFEDWLEQVHGYGCPRYLPRDWAQQIGPEPAPESSPLSVAVHLLEHDPRARRLMDEAARELDEGERPSPSLHVLHDWLHEQDAPVGKASLSTLVTRLVPLLAPPP
jgi:hypothetical protein